MKIFCIGFHKTGTLSLAHAIERCGFTVRHGYKPQSDQIENALQHGKKALRIVENQIGKHNAYADLYAVRRHFTVLDKQYPDAKFILTTRDQQSWVESCKRQMERRSDSPYFHYWYHQVPAQWKLEKMHHEFIVKTYFSTRPDKLLVMNITKGDGYEKLCPFLDVVDMIDEPFPHKNKSQAT